MWQSTSGSHSSGNSRIRSSGPSGLPNLRLEFTLKSLGVLLGLVMIWGSSARALEVRAGGAFLQLPTSSYHYLAYRLDLGIGSDDQWRIAAGMAHPYIRSGLRQLIGNLGISHEWSDGNKGFRPFGALGAGAYFDNAGASMGLVPSVNLRGGFKIGGNNLGLSCELDTHIGVFNLSQIFSWVVWPMYQFVIGVYIAT